MILKDLRDIILNSYFRKFNDDPTDRFHYLHTVVGLSIYLLFISTKSYYGEPIQCIVNNNGEASKYIHSMCWINGTYRSDESEPYDITFDDKKDKMDYYQWMTFIIIFLIFLFSVPSVVWGLLVYINGFDLVHVTKNIIPKLYLDEYFEKDWSNTRKIIENITDHIKMSFLKQKLATKDNDFQVKLADSKENEDLILEQQAINRTRYPNLKVKPVFPLYISYLFVKIFYLANIIIVCMFLTWVFNFDYFEYGYRALNLRLTHGNYEVEKEYFPKKGFCTVKFYSKKYFNLGSYVCSLPINLFNQLFFLGFWYWLITLFSITVGSILYWLKLLSPAVRRKFVLNCLQLDKYNNLIRSYTAAYYLDQDSTVTYDLADRFFIDKTGITLMKNFDLFFRDVCSLDLIFLIKLIEFNSNKLASRDIFNSLWDEYLDLDVMKHNVDIKTLKKRPMIHLKRPKEYDETINNIIKEK